MSLSYAARLTQNVDYGECGLAEKEDTPRVKEKEMSKLVKMLRDPSLYLVLHTGAGISTSCGIRDFRGPKGVWTREKQGFGLHLLPGDVPFDEASPSLTHMACLALVREDRCKFVVSQNVDGLHLRSGMPTDKLAELHGNIFQEKCIGCQHVFFRNFDVGGCGFQKTPRPCDLCGGDLYDMVLDWESSLPERDFALARSHSLLADLSLALGTSMRVHPAATIPLLTVDKSQRLHSNLSNVEVHHSALVDGIVSDAEKKRRLAKNGSFAIVNLQPTPYEKDASVRVHGKTDAVMGEVMRRLGIPIPDFVRTETYFVQQSEKGLLSVATDRFVGNCLFCASISVSFGETKFELTAPQPKYEFDVSAATEGAAIHVLVQLNANATLGQVSITHTKTASASCSQLQCEVVRKHFPFPAEDAWLEAETAEREPDNKKIKN